MASRLSLAQFAGHECGVALAKMSFGEEFLDDQKGCRELNFGEKTELENWISKFRDYRCYPVLGRLIMDIDPDRVVTHQGLKRHNGSGEVPEGYSTAPILFTLELMTKCLMFRSGASLSTVLGVLTTNLRGAMLQGLWR